MMKNLDTITKIRKWLMQFRIVVYTKDRQGDLELMEEEIKEAFRAGLLEKVMYQEALLTIRREKQKNLDSGGS
ncbi:YqgQ family protein [Bacillus piscicola]|uniref:YqgQ family protein n=1 Tax=Bacillus piscicola TaxID=1632684 RepID=UPI001F098322|nr:YqgQ family protein [Bacillus piscicola]